MPLESLREYEQSVEFRSAAAIVGAPRARLRGVWDTTLAFFLAAWKRSRGDDAPSLVVTATAEEAEELVADLETFAPGRALCFSPWESLFLADSDPDPVVCQERVVVLDRLSSKDAGGFVVVASVQSLIQPVPPPQALEASHLDLAAGRDYSVSELAERLAREGFRFVPIVEKPGEFSARGDIVDVYPFSRPRPVRLEFFGDGLESIREFDPSTQRSVGRADLREVRLLFPDARELFVDCFRGTESLLFDYLAPESVVFVHEEASVLSRGERVFHLALERRGRDAWDRFRARLNVLGPTLTGQFAADDPDAPSASVEFISVERFVSVDPDRGFAALETATSEGSRVEVVCESEREEVRFRELFGERGLDRLPGVSLVAGRLRRGFEVRAVRAVILTARELVGRQIVRRRARAPASRAIQNFLELERGDFVVHATHGVGRYTGIEVFAKDEVEQEFLVLQFRGDVRIYVPVSKIDLVQKYIGSGDRPPVLDKVGGVSWERKKETVETSLYCMAAELLDIQAARQERPGFASPPDGDLQRQFEARFPFQDTPDQVSATEEIKVDMLASRPMDRLICGDVGFGKTELAMRAAFKAVEGGRQVAVLVPTTVLAEQHYRNFRERMDGFPVTVEVLSRFRGPGVQKKIIDRIEEGRVDIVIGTHRMLSKDVEFRDLGLLIIDEEQRFGVAHKERFKRLRREVDVLTLSATPIPRTLHMALLGIRDVSNLATPPPGRQPIHTEISRFDRRKCREIIARELNRDGQVLFIHNRIADLPRLKTELEQIVPEARIEVGHGKMRETELEQRMHRFMAREIDVLLATTIIENGIDVPTANTIIISEADLYGLSDLHQLRGRVGRSRQQAYCYLFLPDHRHVGEEARKRLRALVEFSSLGAGFSIAMRDLEIRGAGNLLGKEQSGHIAAVGYDMYCRLLEKCVREIKKEPWSQPVDVEIDLAIQAHVSEGYIAREAEKLEVYRRVSQLTDAGALEELGEELADRYGPLPTEARRLLDVQKLRVLSRDSGVEYVGFQDGNIILRGDESRIQALLADCPRRVAVLDRRTVAIPFHPGRSRPAAIDPDELFEFVLEWFDSKSFPELRPSVRKNLARREVSS